MVEVLHAGPPERPGPRPGWVLLVAGAVLAALALAGWQLAGGSPGAAKTPASSATSAPATSAPSASPPELSEAEECPGAGSSASSTPAVRGELAALAFTGTAPGQTVDRWDQGASRGPWAVVVRRRDGSLGRHSAIVTFPAEPLSYGRAARVGGVSGRVSPGGVSWPIGAAHARVRGDLDEGVLVQIAEGTRVVAGRPRVRPPAGYAVASVGPYRAPHVREVRYYGQLDRVLGGLVYTGVTAIGGFEDQLHSVPTRPCGLVHGRPAVVSSMDGGNGTLAWELAPGQVAYVGYSGSNLYGPVLAAVHRLAQQSQPMDDAQWRATDPRVVLERNRYR